MTKDPHLNVADDRFGGYERRTIITLEDLLQFEKRINARLDSMQANSQGGGTQPQFYKPKEVAKMTGLTEHSVRRRLREGQLAGIQEAGVKGSWLVPREAVTALLESLKKATIPAS